MPLEFENNFRNEETVLTLCIDGANLLYRHLRVDRLIPLFSCGKRKETKTTLSISAYFFLCVFPHLIQLTSIPGNLDLSFSAVLHT